MNVNELAHRLLIGLGIVVLAAGGYGILSTSFAESIPLGNLAIAGLVAVVAVLMGLWIARSRLNTTTEQTELPDPELPLYSPAPGHEIDDMIRRLTEYRQGTIEYRNQIRERLGEVATATIVHREDCTRDEALEKLRRGTWTDNPYAASFFSEEVSAPQQSLGEQLLANFSGQSPYRERVSQTVDAIYRLAGVTSPTETEQTDDEDDAGGLLARLGVGGPQDRASRTASDELRSREREGELVAEGVQYFPLLQTGHWRGVSAFALLAAGVGVFAFKEPVLLVSAVGVGLAAYARAGTPPPLSNLSVERHLSDETPQPGEEVTVTVTVENTGNSTLPDLRLVDRVPGPMYVVEGSPRIGTTLRAGSTVTFEYTVVAARGEHAWPMIAVGRDLSGSLEREAILEVDAQLQCFPRLRTTTEMPLRSQTTVYAGQLDTTMGGSGLEFHSVRDYRPGDPLKRIDWKRKARTGDFATVNFRQERAATVTLLFDARRSAYVSPWPGEQHAVDRSVEAAGDVFAALFDAGDLVGIAAFDTVPCWLGPGAGDEHHERARRLLAGHPALSSIPPEMSEAEGHYVDPMTHVRRQLPMNSQVMIFSPLCDDYAYEVARRLDGAGHLVTVVSPDPTADRTVGQRLARVERAMRIIRLRERGIRVVDWGRDETLRLELERAEQRWQA